jgi:arylsulfatase A
MLLRALLAVLLVSAGAASAAAQEPAKRPNVIVILADDFGYECVGANGGTSYKTPNLDQLAATGARFERCYVQPLCTPTRVQLMTGKYNVRNYVRFGHLDPRATTFAHLFKGAGYRTGMVGKWQLGQAFDLPGHFGFDEYCLWQLTRRPPRYANPGLEVNGKAIDYVSGEYGPDLVNQYAIDFVGKNKDRPFFLYYSMMLTHNPYQPTPDSPEWDPKAMGEKVNQNVKHFGDMTTYMDKLIGKLVAKLDELGVRENTLILFIGDNGTGRGTPSYMGNRLVRGGKGLTISTGMHVPLIVNWKGKTPSGQVSGDLVDSTDILPTICDAAGVKVPPGIDGKSFHAQLRGEKGRPREWIYCWYAPNGGAKADKEFAASHRHKLYRGGELYDYLVDQEEQRPLAASVAAADRQMLQGVLDQYRDARPPELAKGAGEKGKGKGKNKTKKLD